MAQKLGQRIKKVEDIKILFLDVDGVLNTVSDATNTLRPKLIKRLASTIKQTQCKLVLSTSWRTDELAKKLLFTSLRDIGNININEIYIGDTPTIYHKPRAFEIKQYLKSQANTFNILNWVAVDDMPLNKPLHEGRKELLEECQSLMHNHFVQTDEEVGLTEQNVKEIIALLE